MAKSTKPAAAVAAASTIIPALKPAAHAIATAYKKAESAQVAIGAAVIKAASVLKPAQVEPFVGMVREELAGVLSPASLKVEASRMRKALNAILSGEITPDGGETLRQLYEACNKRTDTGAPRHAAPKDADSDEGESTAQARKPATITAGQVADMPDDARRVFLATVIWGYSEPGLIAALEYAESHSGEFIRWAEDAASAAQVAEIERAVAKPAAKKAPARKAPAKKAA